MRLFPAALSLVAMAMSVPTLGLAQTATQASDPFTARQKALSAHWHDFWSICQRARKSETLSTAEKLQVCQIIGEDLDQKIKEPDFAPRDDIEANFFWTSRAGVLSLIQGIYGEADGVLSRRVCEAIIAADQTARRVKSDAWPKTPEGAKLRESQAQARASAANNIARCRANFGL